MRNWLGKQWSRPPSHLGRESLPFSGKPMRMWGGLKYFQWQRTQVSETYSQWEFPHPIWKKKKISFHSSLSMASSCLKGIYTSAKKSLKTVLQILKSTPWINLAKCFDLITPFLGSYPKEIIKNIFKKKSFMNSFVYCTIIHTRAKNNNDSSIRDLLGNWRIVK